MATVAKYQGEIVRDIQFRGITGTNPEMLRSLLALKAGEPLDRNKLRTSMEALLCHRPLCQPAGGGG